MLDDDTDRLLRQVYSAMLYIKDENGKDGKETGRMSIKVGKKYMECMGLNEDEYLLDLMGSAKSHGQTGERVFKHKVWAISLYGDEECKKQEPKGEWFDETAWMKYHETMVTTPGTPIDIHKLRKQLSDEMIKLEKWTKAGQVRSSCDGFMCMQ